MNPDFVLYSIYLTKKQVTLTQFKILQLLQDINKKNFYILLLCLLVLYSHLPILVTKQFFLFQSTFVPKPKSLSTSHKSRL